VDIGFIEWASDESTPLNQKGMNDMIEKYIEIWHEFDRSAARQEVNADGLRQHLYIIMKLMDWCMVKPETIDLQRCNWHSLPISRLDRTPVSVSVTHMKAV